MTETGTGSAARTVARTTARQSSGFAGMAAPAPLRVTLGAGQPKLMSMWSTRSFMRRTASDMTAGSAPKIWSERGLSSAPNSAISCVRQ